MCGGLGWESQFNPKRNHAPSRWTPHFESFRGGGFCCHQKVYKFHKSGSVEFWQGVYICVFKKCMLCVWVYVCLCVCHQCRERHGLNYNVPPQLREFHFFILQKVQNLRASYRTTEERTTRSHLYGFIRHIFIVNGLIVQSTNSSPLLITTRWGVEWYFSINQSELIRVTFNSQWFVIN